MFNDSSLVNAAIGLLDPIVMTNTCSNFPVDLSLERDFDPWKAILEPRPSPHSTVYDPAFVMPLLSNMLLSGAIDCRKFLECNAVGMMLVSLSSNHNDVRKVAYMLLDDFYVVLQVRIQRIGWSHILMTINKIYSSMLNSGSKSR
jgi:hypothetical protein